MDTIDLIRVDPAILKRSTMLYVRATEIGGKIVDLDIKIFRKR